MVVLDTLAPGERLAFVLHDIFGVPFDEIAVIVGRSPIATRQLASRARRRIQGATPPSDVDLAAQRRVVEAFLAALRDGNFEALVAVLDPDVLFRDDSPADAASGVVRGSGQVGQLALGYSKSARFVEPALVEGFAGLAIVMHGRVIGALRFAFAGELVTEIEAISDGERLAQVELASS